MAVFSFHEGTDSRILVGIDSQAEEADVLP